MSPKWIARIFLGVVVAVFSYPFWPNLWWFLPRLLLGHNRAMYGTYEGYVVSKNGLDPQTAGERMLLRLTLRPSLAIDTSNTYGYRWRDLVATPDALGGSLEMREADGTVDHYQVHGHEAGSGEAGPGEAEPQLSFWDGDRTSASVGVTAQAGGVRLEGVSPLRRGSTVGYGGVLTKR